MDRLYHTVGAGVFYVSYNWVLLERGEFTLMAQEQTCNRFNLTLRLRSKSAILDLT